jgi:hypothetical protein
MCSIISYHKCFVTHIKKTSKLSFLKGTYNRCVHAYWVQCNTNGFWWENLIRKTFYKKCQNKFGLWSQPLNTENQRQDIRQQGVTLCPSHRGNQPWHPLYTITMNQSQSAKCNAITQSNYTTWTPYEDSENSPSNLYFSLSCRNSEGSRSVKPW